MLLSRSFPYLQSLALGISLFASAGAVLAAPPVVTQQPGTLTATSGQGATFTVAATGDSDLTYQWRHLGSPISGANTTALSLSNVKMVDAGFYDVVVTAGAASTVSQPGRLLVAPAGGYPNTIRLDTSFAPLFEVPGGTINGVAVAPDGSIYVGGVFSTIAGQRRYNLARFSSSLVLDPSFAPMMDGGVQGVSVIAVQADGKILVGCDSCVVNGIWGRSLVRLNFDGTFDPTFSADIGSLYGAAFVASIQPQADGKILIGGAFETVGGAERQYVARLNFDGSCDASFVPALCNAPVREILAQSDGKVMIRGGFNRIDDLPHRTIARLNSDGTLDSSFDPGIALYQAYAMALDSNGDVRVCAEYVDNGVYQPQLVQLRADGSIDPAFTPVPGFGYGTKHLRCLPDGRMVVALDQYGQSPAFEVLSPSGQVDPSFVFPVVDSALGQVIAVTATNQIVLGGLSLADGTALIGGVAKYGASGGLVASAQPSIRCQGWASICVPVAGEKWVVGGHFSHVNGVRKPNLVRLNGDGTLDMDFDATIAVDAPVSAIVGQGDGRIVVGGDWPSRIARLSADGSRDVSFAPGNGFDVVPDCLQLLPDGRIVATGRFNSYNGETTRNVALICTDGSRDPAFVLSGMDGADYTSLAVTGDGKIAIGGLIILDSNNCIYTNFVILDNRGTVVFPVNYSGYTSNYFVVLDVDASGRIVIGGGFYEFANLARGGFARIDSDGVLAVSDGIGGGFWAKMGGSAIRAFTPQADGKVIVYGSFDFVNGVPCSSPFVRLDATDGLDPSFRVFDVGDFFATKSRYADDGRILLTNGRAIRDGVTRSGLLMLKPESVPAPVITTQPAEVAILSGGTAVLSVGASAAKPLKYQWYTGSGGLIEGANAATFTTPALTGWARYWVRVSDSLNYVDSRTVLVKVTDGSIALADWMEQGGLLPGLRTPLASPAGDGVTNLMKFALGVPPMASATAHLPTPTTYTQAGQPMEIALLFARNPAARGIRYALEVSDNMVTWTEAASVTDVLGDNPDGTQLVRLREAVPPVALRRFARLKVVLVP